MASGFQRYGINWNTDKLSVELTCIRKGGRVRNRNGDVTVIPLYDLYKEAMTLLWPEDDWHRWAELFLREILANKVTGAMGSQNSGKTYMAAKFALADYWAFPNDTGILVSSTDLRGLELRVWGTIKQLYNRALDRWPDLCGNIIESLHSVTSDTVNDGYGRVLKKGIICIPCLSSGRYVGLGKYVGFKMPRVRLIADECFVSGTMVDSPNGPIPIEDVREGDLVYSASGPRRVLHTMNRKVDSLSTVYTSDGRRVTCTPNHRFLTQKGWIPAIDMTQEHYMVSPYEAMQILRSGNEELGFLRQTLSGEMDYHDSGRPKEVLHQGERGENFNCEAQDAQGQARACRSSKAQADREQSNVERGCQAEGVSNSEGNAMASSREAWEWNRTNESGGIASGIISLGKEQFPCKNRHEQESWIPGPLQAGHCIPGVEARGRGGWILPSHPGETSKRQEEGGPALGAWVDHIEIHEPPSDGGNKVGERVHTVFNLEVEGHPSYSVNGFLVHNCQFMGPTFLDAISNLAGNPDFKCVIMGNPIDPEDPLGRACEPEDGWNSMPEPTVTTVWKTKFLDGKCVNFVGTDSPNFDPPVESKPRFPYLISSRTVNEVEAFWGRDSQQFWSQVMGVMKTGLLARRVITRELCREHRALERAVWEDLSHTKVYAVDAAYSGTGGDRCVGGWVEFGQSVDGQQILRVNRPVIIPVLMTSKDQPEDQIAKYVQNEIEANGIEPTNVFYDSTGRGTLGSAFARCFGERTPVPVEFGGRPSDRPVRYDLFTDLDGERRLKTCREHYVDFVSELWFSVRYAIESEQVRELPEDVMREGCQREYGTAKTNKFFVESKHDPKARERMGRSPDLFDWLATAVEGARRLGFKIQKLGVPLVEKNQDEDWFTIEEREFQDVLHSKLLTHS